MSEEMTKELEGFLRARDAIEMILPPAYRVRKRYGHEAKRDWKFDVDSFAPRPFVGVIDHRIFVSASGVDDPCKFVAAVRFGMNGSVHVPGEFAEPVDAVQAAILFVARRILLNLTEIVGERRFPQGFADGVARSIEGTARLTVTASLTGAHV